MASTKTRSAKISPEEYREFVQGLELKHVYLSAAKVKRVRMPDVAVPLRYGHNISKKRYSNSEEGFSASFTFQVTLFEEGVEAPFGEIDVTFTAEYTAKQAMTKKIFEVFGDINLPLNVFPYIREYVHTTTNRMGFPTLILPTYKSG
jgi:preprotein translocase subunit SecB